MEVETVGVVEEQFNSRLSSFSSAGTSGNSKSEKDSELDTLIWMITYWYDCRICSVLHNYS